MKEEHVTNKPTVGKTVARIGLLACAKMLDAVLRDMLAAAAMSGDARSLAVVRAIGFKLDAVRSRLEGDEKSALVFDMLARESTVKPETPKSGRFAAS